jgi:hypothetical protein
MACCGVFVERGRGECDTLLPPGLVDGTLLSSVGLLAAIVA